MRAHAHTIIARAPGPARRAFSRPMGLPTLEAPKPTLTSCEPYNRLLTSLLPAPLFLHLHDPSSAPAGYGLRHRVPPCDDSDPCRSRITPSKQTRTPVLAIIKEHRRPRIDLQGPSQTLSVMRHSPSALNPPPPLLRLIVTHLLIVIHIRPPGPSLRPSRASAS